MVMIVLRFGVKYFILTKHFLLSMIRMVAEILTHQESPLCVLILGKYRRYPVMTIPISCATKQIVNSI